MTESDIKSGDRVEDRIRQHRQASGRPILLVEGPDDQLVLRTHLEGVDIFPSSGKTNVLRATRKLQSWNIGGFFAVFDMDFDDAESLNDISNHIYPYSRRDLEAMLIGLGVLKTVIEHQGSHEKLEAYGGADALVFKIQEVVYPVTAIREASQELRWGLNFKDVDIAGKVDRNDLSLSATSYFWALLGKSDASIGFSDIEECISGRDSSNLGPRGKDVLAVAGVALRKVVGSLKSAAVEEDVLVKQLHSSSGLAVANSEWLRRLKASLVDWDEGGFR